MTFLSIIPSHKIASWLISNIHYGLTELGLRNDRTARECIYVIVILLFSIIIGRLIRLAVLSVTRNIVKLRDNELSRQILRQHTLCKCSHVIPPLIFMALIPWAFTPGAHILNILIKISAVYTFIALAIGTNAVLELAFTRYNSRVNTRNLPIRGVLNIATGTIWIIITILSVSFILDKSPAVLLTGLGAFAAALLLIFKDSILGFVAGIQMSQNDMLRVGDWIVVPSTDANGIVVDVSLSVVKIQNWDNTIVMVPPYTLVSTSFQNWRGMSDSGIRRIMRAFTIDITSVRPLSPDLRRLITEKVPHLDDFISSLDNSDTPFRALKGSRPVNGSCESNLGLFRAYITMYLSDNPFISKEAQILVRLLDPTDNGFPLQIWCWTNTTDWNAYEAIQSAISEHIALMAGTFALQIYTASTESVTVTTATE